MAAALGLMGAMADAALAAGGRVLGVIPEFLTRWEVAHQGVAELVVTDTMHSRKRRMFEAADVFVSFPGGLGTLDETIEIITWRQLQLHDKPILLCDVAGWPRPCWRDRGGDRNRLCPADARHLYERRGCAGGAARLRAWPRGRGGAPARCSGALPGRAGGYMPRSAGV